jgi:abortive infection bacteriophage resistance protein
MSNPPPLPAYQKPWLSFPEQIALLQSRGMVVDDVQAAVEFLQHVNYYRFSGFCVAFESSRVSADSVSRLSLPGTSFQLV